MNLTILLSVIIALRISLVLFLFSSLLFLAMLLYCTVLVIPSQFSEYLFSLKKAKKVKTKILVREL